MSILIAVVFLVPGISDLSAAEIGAGSNLRVKTQTQMLFQQGGGYVTWDISGPVVKDIRRSIDEGFGDSDGNVTDLEGTAFTGEIDGLLENNVFYGCARVVRSALLTKVIQTSTDGLLGPVNSSQAINIRFYFNADLRPDGATIDMGDTTIPLAIIRALRGDGNRTFAGTLDWEHQEIMVGFSSFSRAEMDRGTLSRVRVPGAEVFWYHLTLSGNASSRDRLRYDTFDAVQCPLELFVGICIFGAVMIWFPRYYLRSSKLSKVRWLHLLVLLLVVCLLAIFFSGADGAAVWTLSPVLAFLSWVLSWGIYVRKWKGIAKPLVPEKVRRRPEPLPEEDRAAHADGSAPLPAGWTPKGPRDFPEPGLPEPGQPRVETGPAPVAAVPPQKTAAPLVPDTAVRKLRCPKCKATFDIKDPGTRPLPIICTACGTEGLLNK
jgi:hypothetical protein